MEEKLKSMNVPHGFSVLQTSLNSWDYNRAAKVMVAGDGYTSQDPTVKVKVNMGELATYIQSVYKKEPVEYSNMKDIVSSTENEGSEEWT